MKLIRNLKESSNNSENVSKITGIINKLSEAALRRTKINIRLIVSFLVLSIIPLGMVGFASLRYASSAMEENTGRYSTQIVTQ